MRRRLWGRVSSCIVTPSHRRGNRRTRARRTLDDSGGVGGDSPTEPPPVLPLIPVPTGCSVPRMPHIVFVGEVVDRDYRTIRFEIDRIRDGRPIRSRLDGLIDVRFGLDAQYLDDGGAYLVSAVVDPDLGLLVSRVSDPIENFGGDEVIGVSETDVNCPVFEDPMRTLHLDGTPVYTSVVEPFFDAQAAISSALVATAGRRARRDLRARHVPAESLRACIAASSTPAAGASTRRRSSSASSR